MPPPASLAQPFVSFVSSSSSLDSPIHDAKPHTARTFLRRQRTIECGTKSASSLRGRRNLGRNRYDMMSRLLRTREFLRDEASNTRKNSQLGKRAGRDSTQV